MSRFGRDIHLRLAPRPRVDLDWKLYFREFSKRHGDNPVGIDGRLVFEDGWAYSDSDYRGPQFPPPSNPVELKHLMIAYWQERLNVVRARLSATVKELQGLEQTAAGLGDHGNIAFLRSLVPKEGGGWDRRVKEIMEHVNDPLLRQVVSFLRDDQERCKEKLKGLKEGVATA